MSLDTIQAALKQARETAGAAVPAVATTTPAAVAPGRPVSMREALATGASMSVKAYLKVDRVAFLIGKDDGLHKEFEVEFRFNEAQPFFGLRYGNPARYERSVDRVTNSRNGRSWADCVAEAQRMDSRCRGDYVSVDVPFTLVNDIMAADKKTVLIKTGEKIGWTASITNFKDFKEFAAPYYALMDQGLLSDDALVRGKIKHVKRTGGEADYGALTFVDFDVVDNGSKESN